MKLRLRTTQRKKEEPVIDIWLDEPDCIGDINIMLSLNGNSYLLAWISASLGEIRRASYSGREKGELEKAGFTFSGDLVTAK